MGLHGRDILIACFSVEDMPCEPIGDVSSIDRAEAGSRNHEARITKIEWVQLEAKGNHLLLERRFQR